MEELIWSERKITVAIPPPPIQPPFVTLDFSGRTRATQLIYSYKHNTRVILNTCPAYPPVGGALGGDHEI